MKKLLSQQIQNVKNKCIEFILDERSARGSVEEGQLSYAGIVIGLILLLIGSQFIDEGFNIIGNFFTDGVNGDHNESGLNTWGDHTDGFRNK